jgi:isopentenyl-diphosphate delta-isomerase
MGFNASLRKIFDFVYETSFDNGLIENEFDHVFAGTYDGEIKMNHEEVRDYCFKTVNELKQDLVIKPEKYTAWFHIAFPKIEEWLKTNSGRLSQNG